MLEKERFKISDSRLCFKKLKKDEQNKIYYSKTSKRKEMIKSGKSIKQKMGKQWRKISETKLASLK